jgi:lactate permease
LSSGRDLNWLATTGTQLLPCGLLTMLALRIRPRVALRAYGERLVRLRAAILTITTVLALAYVMNLSGQTVTIGLSAAGAGGMFALISPLIGWLGVAITGSVAASNSLLGELRETRARRLAASVAWPRPWTRAWEAVGTQLRHDSLAIQCTVQRFSAFYRAF